MSTSAPLHGGWYLVGAADHLDGPLTPLDVVGRRLMIVRHEDGRHEVAVATCPHRGAHLAIGGQLHNARVVCPFHGRTVTVGGPDARGMCVPTFPTRTVGGMIFARFGDADTGLIDDLDGLIHEQTTVLAVDEEMDTTPELIIENAFDPEHFSTVHHVPKLDAMSAERDNRGALVVGGGFRTATSPWVAPEVRDKYRQLVGGRSKATQRSGFRATAYSPTLVVTACGDGPSAPLIITGAVPITSTGAQPRCRVRVMVVSSAEPAVLARIVTGSQKALREDRPVWENLDLDHQPQLTEQDATVAQFHDFCAGFAPANP